MINKDARKKTACKNDLDINFRDKQTGLYNHMVFQMFLEHEIKRCQRKSNSCCIALLDIDCLEPVKLPRDHAVDSQTLRLASGIILKNIREVDISTYCCNGTFAILFPDTENNMAAQAAERIRLSVLQLESHSIGFNIGLANFPEDSTSVGGLLRKAEDALRIAKNKGGNRVFYFDSATPAAIMPETVQVMIVDDNHLNLKMIEGLLIPLNYEVIKAQSGTEALRIARKIDLDVILLDVMMPELDGFEVCRRLKSDSLTRKVPIIMITALDDIDSRIKGIEAGADDFITKPPNKLELRARTKSLIRTKRLDKTFTSIENVLFSLAKAVEAKDAYTQGHVERVAHLAVTLGKKLGLSMDDIEALRYGGILHDIGKIGMPRDLINKPSGFDDKEWLIMRQHPEVGYQICLPLKDTLGPALDAIRHHHEKLDGSGYPDGLSDKEITIFARILAVADIYDALVTDRPYRKGMKREKALQILQQEAGQGKLDSTVVGKIFDIMN